jgi:hypothetical protein
LFYCKEEIIKYRVAHNTINNRMAPYTPVFATALVLNVAVTVRSSGLWTKYFATTTTTGDDADPLLGGSTDKKQEEKKRHSDLLKRYLIVYLLATLSDWLQGPYVYALYAAYGYSQHDIAVLFVAGFGSSKSYPNESRLYFYYSKNTFVIRTKYGRNI